MPLSDYGILFDPSWVEQQPQQQGALASILSKSEHALSNEDKQRGLDKLGFGNNPWSNADVARQLAYLSLLGIDINQSKKSISSGQRHEVNPIVSHFAGKNPSRGQFNNIGLATALGHTGLMDLLSPDWRKWFQGLSIAGEAGTTYINHTTGF